MSICHLGVIITFWAREMVVNMFGLLMGLFAAAFIVPISASGCYGDIEAIDTTGASCLTASYDRLPYCGVQASEIMAKADLWPMGLYKTKITNVAQRLCVDPALIAAIISRETRAGKRLYSGWDSKGSAWGLMQVDVRWHTIAGTWDSEDHLYQATDILVYMIGQIKRKFPGWTKEQQLKGGIAAYNVGPGNVGSYSNVDGGTTGRDYSNDVAARAIVYRRYEYTM